LCSVSPLHFLHNIDDASAEDCQKLFDIYKIRSIIDLRTKTEHIQNAEKRKAKMASSEAASLSNDDAAEVLQIPGITYHNINFNGSAYSKMLISQLSWGNTFKLIGRMAIGHRTEGIKVLGENVMTARGLVCQLFLEQQGIC
jgi:protein-tyrosine phosphatase